MDDGGGLRLEDWIGERVTVNLYNTAEVTSETTRMEGVETVSHEETVSDRPLIVAIEGFLQGVNPNGIIVLFDPARDVTTSLPGQVHRTGPEPPPTHVFYPWQRVSLIQRIEGEAE